MALNRFKLITASSIISADLRYYHIVVDIIEYPQKSRLKKIIKMSGSDLWTKKCLDFNLMNFGIQAFKKDFKISFFFKSYQN